MHDLSGQQRRYAFIFIVQHGELEIKALLLAASLKRFLRCQHELIAAIPAPAGKWGAPSDCTLEVLRQLDVRAVPITNPISDDYPIGNKLASLSVPTEADKIVFLDSDMVALREFADQERFSLPFHAKPADLQTFTTGPQVWRKVYEAADVSDPLLQLPTTTSNELGPPYFNSGFIAVDAAAAFAETWVECCRRIFALEVIPDKTFVDQIGLAVAVAKSGLSFDALDERYNFPAHLKPIDENRLPYFCHYHSAQVFGREPVLRELICSLTEEHPGISEMLEMFPEWRGTTRARPATRARARRPTLIISGRKRCGLFPPPPSRSPWSRDRESRLPGSPSAPAAKPPGARWQNPKSLFPARVD